MNYAEAMNYIKSTAKFGSNLGLERTEKILELLGNPHKQLKCIHIAGTNGKGSTTAMLSSILVKAGYKVGMYISPYIEEFEERIQIDGKNIPKEDLSECVSELAEVVAKVADMGYDHPTEFEIITCAMFLYFYKKSVDYAVVEVGLGGRLDSTNVITPLASVITSISYDHMNILGDSLEEIAGEKAGIIKPGVPVVVFPQKEESLQVLKKTCQERNSEMILVPEECVEFKGMEEGLQTIKISTSSNAYTVHLSLLGVHQQLNCAVVVHTVEKLRNLGIHIEEDHLIGGLRDVKWPGRLEIMKRNPLVVIDGAHNIDGIKKLSESVDMYFEYDRMILILGILADKQVEEMVKTIVPKAHKVIAVTPMSERAKLASELMEVVEKYNKQCECIESYEEAYLKALSCCEDKDILLISGSLYMIGEMRKIIRKNL